MEENKIVTTFRSVTGAALDRVIWLPEGKPKGIVQFVHGMAEHIERYEPSARAFNKAGYIVVGHTHLGHGPKAETLGWFGEKDGWQHLIDDVHTNRLLTEKEYPGLPYFLFGHSMGSFVVRCYLTEHSKGLAGAVVCGTGSYAPAVLDAGLVISGFLCGIGRAKKLSPFINRIAFGSNNNDFKPARTLFDWLSRDTAIVDAYLADPYCGHPFTAAGYRDLFRGLKRMTRPELLKAIAPDLPVLFISGAADPVGSCGTGVRQAAKTFTDADIREVTVKLYPDCRHEILNETNREEVWQDLVQWFDGHIG